MSGSDPGASLCFNWTGGILNSSDVTSTVTIKGAGAITPANAGTVTLGSTLVFVGTQAAPKDSTINPGTIATKAAASIVVGAFSNVTARVATIGDVIGITKQQAGAQQIAIQSNGALFYIGPGTINNNLPISNAGGLFKLMDVVRVNLSGGSPVANDWDYSQTVADSRLHIENGSILTVQNKMLMSTGSLYLLMNPNLTAGEQTATITGKFVMTGGDIVFSPPIVIATQVVYGTLTVNGDVDWSGGRYIPSVDYTTAGLANEWIVNGTMTSAAACILQPNPQRGQNPPANSNWEVLIATTTAGNVPQLPQGCPLTLSVVPGTPVKWKLLS